MIELISSNIIQLNFKGPNFSFGRDEFVNKVEENAKKFEKYFLEESNPNLIAIENDNSVSFLIKLFTIWKFKKTALILDSLLSHNEVDNILNFYRPNFLIKSDEVEPIKLSEFVHESVHEIALILLTSGTTGTPKGVKISFNSLKSKIHTLKQAIEESDMENALNFLPMSFGHGLIANTLFPMCTSKNFYFVDRLDLGLINNLEEICSKYSINFFSSVPSFWRLLEAGGVNLKNSSTLKRIHCASADLSSNLAAFVLDSIPFSCKFYNTYGITELSSWVGICQVTDKNTMNQFSFFNNVEYKFINNEIYLKAPFMFSGYFNLDSTDIDSDGFFKTGDVFEDNKLIARLKETVNKGGLKIYLNEIDKLVLNSNMVQDAISVRYFLKEEEMLGLIVVMKENFKLDELEAYLKLKISKTKLPNKILSLKNIERNARGKINREELAKVFI